MSLVNTQTCTNSSVYQFALRGEGWCTCVAPGLESFLGICAILVHENSILEEDTWPILGSSAKGDAAFRTDPFLDRVSKSTLNLS